MRIDTRTVEQVTVVEIAGRIDAKTAPEVRGRILPLVQPGSKMILDMTHVTYMSSTGLRMLAATYRQVSSHDGQLVLVGLSERLQDTMSITGFLPFFITHETVEAALAALK